VSASGMNSVNTQSTCRSAAAGSSPRCGRSSATDLMHWTRPAGPLSMKLRRTLGQGMGGCVYEEAAARAPVTLVDGLVQSAYLDDAAITSLLNQARGLADRMLAEAAWEWANGPR
jgi:hypothetical protein